MHQKTKLQYRKSPRNPYWDYRTQGAYFITICTKNRIHYFGEIQNQEMILSPVGILANVFWYEIKNHAKNVSLGDFIVMPNHVHGILILNGNQEGKEEYTADIPIGKLTQHRRFQNIGKNSVSSMIGGYKSAVTKHARRLGYEMNWQGRFHDVIIKDERAFNNISQYIRNNPAKWEADCFRNG